MATYFRIRTVPVNAWLGVSVENRKYGVPRIDMLREIAATIRFLSIEPMLEDVGDLDLSGIHWVVVGGESGQKARPMRPEWVDNVKRRCEDADVPFSFKQWGAWGADGQRRSKKANGRSFAGRIWDELPA
jgi:protein gp37